MTDVILSAVFAVGTILIAGGTWMAYRVARLADHPPIGWVLLAVSFGAAFLRSVVFLYGYLLPTESQAPYVYFGQLITLPIFVLILAGVYYLRRDFMRQLRDKQAALISPDE